MRSFASLAPYYGAALVVLAIGVARGRAVTWPAIAGVVAGLAFGLVLANGIKLVCWRARPVFPVDGVQFDSFPSGHTASIAFCLAAALQLLALRSRRGDWWWWTTAVVGGVLTVAVAFVRLYLQRHWATDVSASLLMALAFWGGMSSARISPALVVCTLGLGLLVLGGVNTLLPSPASTIQTRPTPRDAAARTLRQEKDRARLPGSAPQSSRG
jgi:membrane-associated phospholipid phosphatase